MNRDADEEENRTYEWDITYYEDGESTVLEYSYLTD